MGTRVPDNPHIGFCPWDNPLWPPGETPRYAQVSFSGMENQLRIYWPDVEPANGTYYCEQIDATNWRFFNLLVNVNLTINTSGVYLVLIVGLYHFTGHNPYPFTVHLANELILGQYGPIAGGFARWAMLNDIPKTADNLGLDLGLKTFSELMGRDLRLAQRTTGTCVYVR